MTQSADQRRSELVEIVARAIAGLYGDKSDPADWANEANTIASAVATAGYAKRSDTIEECQQTILADAGAWGDAAFSLAEQIANLKDKP